MNYFPEPSWQDIQSFLKKEDFVELNFDDNWYVLMQKEKKNVRIPKLNNISKPCLENIIQASDIDERKFRNVIRRK